MPLCVLYVDGASRGNPGDSAIGVSLQQPNGTEMETISEAIGYATNNEAEYRALLAGLELAKQRNFDEVEIRADSQLMVRQLTGEYRVKDRKLRDMYDEVRDALEGFQRFSVHHVSREQNSRADELANEALDRE